MTGFFGSLREAHNIICPPSKAVWLGCPYIEQDGIYVQAWKCPTCGLEWWTMRSSGRGATEKYSRIVDEFNYQEGLEKVNRRPEGRGK